jgi:cobalt-zinc-cadmium efflux system protein
VLIMKSTWSLLREALDMTLGAVPGNVDAGEVEKYLLACPGV